MSILYIFYASKNMGKCSSRLHFFSSKTSIKFAINSFTKCVSYYLKLVNLFGKRHSVSEQFKWLLKSPFSLATPQLHEDLDQTGNHIQTTPRISSFWQGVICHFLVSQFRDHREQTLGVRLCVKVPHPTVSKQLFLHKFIIFSKEEA